MNQADTAWMLVSTALVLLMTPALAFFYGGLVRSKHVLNAMMMSFVSLGVVGDRVGGRSGTRSRSPRATPWSGGRRACSSMASASSPNGTIPHLLYMCYQGTFAIITAALISGAIVERMRFPAYVVFITLVVDRRVQPDRALGVGRRMAGADGRPRLRRRHRRARQRRRRGACRRQGGRTAARLSVGRAPAAQHSVHAAGRRTVVVRVVRLQCGQRRGRQRHCGPRVHRDDARAGRARWSSGCSWTSCGRGIPPRSAPRRRSSSAWSRSRRRRASSVR